MTVFALKLIALSSMVIDHLGYFLRQNVLINGDVYSLMRSIGRMAFPMYCFLLVNGFMKSSDRRRYLGRLLLFAALSQLPFSLALSADNYFLEGIGAAALDFTYGLLPSLGFCLLFLGLYILLTGFDRSAVYLALFLALGLTELRLGELVLLGESLNVFYTLAFSLASMVMLEELGQADKPLLPAMLKAVFLVLAMVVYLPRADYDYWGLFLILLLYLCRDYRLMQLAALAAWCILRYYPAGALRLIFSLMSLLPLMLYKGRRGRALKLGFYAFYPLHLLILGVVNLFI